MHNTIKLGLGCSNFYCKGQKIKILKIKYYIYFFLGAKSGNSFELLGWSWGRPPHDAHKKCENNFDMRAYVD